VLALLLLDAGRVVSSGRLIDELWGDDPPEDAATALQQHVSRLRKLLEPHDVLETRSPGYVLAIAPEQLDLTRFERTAAEGKRLLDHGRVDEAARTLRSALELWRGEPLADLSAEPFARDAVPRLQEARLEALEARIDADLAEGRHAELVGELRTLVREHPFRERLRAQLMLALYRSGRQSEALDEFADARRTLVGELGLEPGPELQRLQQGILAHDPALEAPTPLRSARRTQRRLLVAGVAALILAAVAAATAAFLSLRDDETSAAAVTPGRGAVLALDAATGAVRRQLALGRTPSAIAAGDGSVWVVDADARTVLRFDESARVVDTLATGATPTDVVVAGGSAWVANGHALPDAQFVGPVATAVARLDAATGAARADIRLPRRGGTLSNLVENHLAVQDGALWAITPDYSVVRIDADTGEITARSSAVPAAALAAGPAGVWVVGTDGTVVRLDERTARPLARAKVPSVGAIAVGRDAAWVTSPVDGTLWRIGTGPTPTVGSIDVGRGAFDVAVGADGVWIANPETGSVAKVGLDSGRVERTVKLHGIPRSIAVDGSTLWVATVADPIAAKTASAGVHLFPGSTCEPTLAGRGGSDVLVVSDLPLQGGVATTTGQMAQAVAFIVRQRGFRAGRFRVAYQSCDDSLASTGLFDEAKCAANARAYAANRDVVGVIGPYNSPCALAALPELNRAPGGPLAEVSPSNSFVGLTRGGPGVDPSLPAALYPTGRRNYLRVFPTDDLQAAALAVLARDRARRRVYVLDDGEPGYGGLMATNFETAATRLGLDVVGRATWDQQARRYTTLAGRVHRSGAEAVFVGGLLDTNAGAVVRDLRARLGPSVDLLGPDGLTPLPLLVDKAGPAALDVHVSLAGVVTETLPAAGARFVRAFRQAHPRAEVEPSSVYAAQATEVLLDAIARSDGSRASVLRELFRTHVRNGLLGSFGFDARGDTTESPVTILRAAGKGASAGIRSVTAGGVVEKVVRPSPRLVAPGR
jgi:branched-chain amino acid transport system substrate-binding protein